MAQELFLLIQIQAGNWSLLLLSGYMCFILFITGFLLEKKIGEVNTLRQ